MRVESVFRGDQRVMVVWSRPNTQGVWTTTSRGYYAAGALVALESDEDLDGFLETLVVFRSGPDDMDVFTRHRDGSVEPVSIERLRAFKNQNAAISDFVDRFADENADPGKSAKATKEAQKKLRDAEQEKTSGKK